MAENSFVVVFPSVFAKNKTSHLISNIKKILTLKNQQFQSVKKDHDVIIVKANDPVFASSAINLLFGVKLVAIAKKTNKEFESIVNEITKIGGNLLLKGDKFYVKVEGFTSGFLTKDIEIAATSSIIESKSKLGAKPGTEEKHDKLLYSYLTKKNAYICIFSDKGHGGLPYGYKNKKILCCIHDELSAVSCIETIKQGFDVNIIVCYRKTSELTKLAKILNRIIPLTIKTKIDLDFIRISIKPTGVENYGVFIKTITEILIEIANKNKINRISLSLSPLIFSTEIIEDSLKNIFEKNFIPYLPISGLDENIFETSKEIGLEKYLGNIEKLAKTQVPLSHKKVTGIVKSAIKTGKKISISVGPNNVHDILDSLQ